MIVKKESDTLLVQEFIFFSNSCSAETAHFSWSAIEMSLVFSLAWWLMIQGKQVDLGPRLLNFHDIFCKTVLNTSEVTCQVVPDHLKKQKLFFSFLFFNSWNEKQPHSSTEIAQQALEMPSSCWTFLLFMEIISLNQWRYFTDLSSWVGFFFPHVWGFTSLDEMALMFVERREFPVEKPSLGPSDNLGCL